MTFEQRQELRKRIDQAKRHAIATARSRDLNVEQWDDEDVVRPLDEAERRRIRTRLRNGEHQRTLAAEYGVSTSTISAIKHGRKMARHRRAA